MDPLTRGPPAGTVVAMARISRTLTRFGLPATAAPTLALAGLPAWCTVVALLTGVALCVLDVVVTQVLRLRACAHGTDPHARRAGDRGRRQRLACTR